MKGDSAFAAQSALKSLGDRRCSCTRLSCSVRATRSSAHDRLAHLGRTLDVTCLVNNQANLSAFQGCCPRKLANGLSYASTRKSSVSGSLRSCTEDMAMSLASARQASINDPTAVRAVLRGKSRLTKGSPSVLAYAPIRDRGTV